MSQPLTHPSISVVIPLYNRAAFIADAVATVLAQTVPVLEILIVDDGPSIVAAMTEPKVRLISLPANVGGGGARNAGILEAKGDLLALLDSDDSWAPDKLARQIAALAAAPDPANSLCYTNLRIIEDGRDVGLWNTRGPAPGEPLADYLVTHAQAVQTSTIVMPTALAQSVLFDPRLRRHQDWDFVLRAAEAGAQLVYVDEPLVNYLRNSDGNSVSTQGDPAPSLLWMETAKPLLTPHALAWLEVEQVYPRLVGRDPKAAGQIVRRALAAGLYPRLRLARVVARMGPLGQLWRRVKPRRRPAG